MNAPAKIELDFETVAEAMAREGVHQLRRWPVSNFTIELMDGRTGQGKTFRAAIDQAKRKSSQVAA